VRGRVIGADFARVDAGVAAVMLSSGFFLAPMIAFSEGSAAR
jgi:hypothetical protein